MALIAGVQYSGTPAGTIMACGTSGALPRTLLCDGAAYSRPISAGGTVDTYKDLWNAIGTAYGTGDGSTTFNVPDARNVFLRGANASTRAISGVTYPAVARGTTYGDKMQGHGHDLYGNTSGGSSWNLGASPQGVSGGNGGTGLGYFRQGSGSRFVSDPIVDAAGNGTPRTGGETAPVHIGVNYCIAF